MGCPLLSELVQLVVTNMKQFRGNYARSSVHASRNTGYDVR